MMKYASSKQAPPGWCVCLWACTVLYIGFCLHSAMPSMLHVSVRTCRWSMRMFPQHFFAKDRYLWTMLCLCCKLALPTKYVNWFPFLCIISANMIQVDWISLLILCCMRFHCVLYHIYISIVSFDILIYFFVLFNFLHKLWKQFCTLILNMNI